MRLLKRLQLRSESPRLPVRTKEEFEDWPRRRAAALCAFVTTRSSRTARGRADLTSSAFLASLTMAVPPEVGITRWQLRRGCARYGAKRHLTAMSFRATTMQRTSAPLRETNGVSAGFGRFEAAGKVTSRVIQLNHYCSPLVPSPLSIPLRVSPLSACSPGGRFNAFAWPRTVCRPRRRPSFTVRTTRHLTLFQITRTSRASPHGGLCGLPSQSEFFVDMQKHFTATREFRPASAALSPAVPTAGRLRISRGLQGKRLRLLQAMRPDNACILNVTAAAGRYRCLFALICKAHALSLHAKS